jgi:NAD(P)-dependent dehydrogenase (short-subunit alcohol dehydrogenase family)
MYTKTNRIDGKVVIITGCNTGLGKAAAIELAKRGAKLYMACRDMTKCEEARQEIVELSNNKAVFARELDLSSLKSVRKFAQHFHEDETRLDILINNAGVNLMPKSRTKDGFESHMGINYLGHFLLTHLLLDVLQVSVWHFQCFFVTSLVTKLQASTPSRILNLSSSAHYVAKINRNDLMMDRGFYMKFFQYANSKLACTLFTLQLDKILAGTGITVNSVNPGEVETDIARNLAWERLVEMKYSYFSFFSNFEFCSIFLAPFLKMIYKPVHIGVQTHLMAAIDPELEKVSGRYLLNCRIVEPSEKALDYETAEWLWNESARLTGLDKVEST